MSKVNPRLVYWIAALYDHKELTAAHHLVLTYLAVKKLDYGTGAGYCSVRTLAAELGSGEATVRRALDLAQKVGVLERPSRGHRRGDGTVAASTWQVRYPPQPLRAERLTVSSDHGRAVETASTAQGERLNRSLAAPQPLAGEHPTGSEISGSEYPSGPGASALGLLRAADPSVTAEEADWILSKIKASPRVRDPLAVLSAAVERGHAAGHIARARAALVNPGRLPSARPLAEAIAAAMPDAGSAPSTEAGRCQAIEAARRTAEAARRAQAGQP